MKWFGNLFTKSKLMIISGILGILCFGYLAFNSLSPFSPGMVGYALAAILSAVLLVCYKKGEISAQKTLAGAILAVLMYWHWQITVGVFGTESSVLIATFENMMTLAVTIIFINHILLQTDHKGDLKIIRFSQFVLVVAIVLQFIELILQLFSRTNMYYDKIHCLGMLAIVIMITCMEARIQRYKARRFMAIKAGKWTEEERRKCKRIFKF